MKKSLLTFLGLFILALIKTPTLQGQSCSARLAHDRAELIKLYNATNGANWKRKWDLSKPVSTWHGVYLTYDGCSVRFIFLRSPNGLSGLIPNLNLPKLEWLVLENNQLSGSIPNFDHLPKLVGLSLKHNQLSRSIPNFNFPRLKTLNLSTNELSGSIPNFDLPELDWLDLYSNQLSGSIPNFDLPKLGRLKLDNNQLSGSIPNFDHLPKLYWLGLYDNQLSGSIPNFNLPNLYWLDLNVNQLSGTIPNFNLPDLKYLPLSNNQLSGAIPNFDNMPKLEQLYLNNNQLSGGIPSFDHSPSLEYLDVTNNYFTFEGIEFDLNDINRYISFKPQYLIPIHVSKEHILSVKAGGGLENNTYTWYRDDKKYKTIVGDSALIITDPGNYYCKILNRTFSQGDYDNEFVLQSNTIFVWYRDDNKYKTIVGDSALIITDTCNHYCKVLNRTFSQGDYDNEFVLQSNYTFGAISHVETKRLAKGISPQESGIILFPNPAKGSVSIDAKGVKGKRVDIQVFDQLGDLRLKRSIKQSTNAKISLDVSSLSQGHYYVQIKVGGKVVVTKPLIISY